MKLFKKINSYSNNVALIDGNGDSYSYKYLINFSKNIFKFIEKRSLVILISSNSQESISFYVSSIINDYCLILLDKNSDLGFIKETIKKFEPNFIFYPKKFDKDFNTKNVVWNSKNYFLVNLSKKKREEINKLNSLILTTSGTTQNPKFVRLSNKNIYVNSFQISDYLKIKKWDTTITTMSMAYSYGLSIINTHLENGSKIILNDDSVININFWKKLKRNKVNSFGGVPVIYEYLKKIKFENMLPNSIKYLTVAGGKLDSEVLEYLCKVCKKKNIKFFAMYGQTEASPRMSYVNITKNPSKIGAIGVPVINSKIKFLGEKNTIINKKNTVGELVYFGKNVSLGYASEKKDLKNGDSNKGKIFTGDMGYKDKDNFFFLTSRKKRISKLFGLRVNLDDIDNLLKKKGFKVNSIVDDKYIQLNYNHNYQEEIIKNIIFENFKINKNYIKCTLLKKTNRFKNF